MGQTEIANEVRRRVRVFRHARGLTQEALGERCGLSPDAISRIEAGSRVPTLQTLARLADGLRISLPHLVDVGVPVRPTRPKEVDILAELVENEPKQVQRVAIAIVRALVRSMQRKGSRG